MRLVTVAAAALLVPLAGCSVGDAPEEPDAKTVELRVSPAKFDRTNQVIGDAVTLSMTVTNTGDTKAPNLVVTLRGLEESESPLQGNEGTELTRDGERPSTKTRAPWFVDEGPGGTGLAGSTTYDAGPLEPGRSRTLRWRLAAMVAGEHELRYEVVSGLTDKQAKATEGTGLTGSVRGTITNTEQASDAQ